MSLQLKKSAQETAECLLRTSAVKLNQENPFKWTSGIESPIYCDNRKILGNPEIWHKVISLLTKLVSEKFEKIEAIVGVATAGIPHGAVIASNLKLPFGYVRSEPRKHGLGNQIEGLSHDDKRIVVIEDLISTAKSSVAAVNTLRESGYRVIGLVSIFSDGFDNAKKILKENDIENYSLCDLETLSRVAIDKNYISAEELKPIMSFAHSPYTWRNNAEIMKVKQETPSASQTLAKDDFNTGI